MSRNDDTDRPRPGLNPYPDTQWSRIARAQGGSLDDLGLLLTTYRQPLLAFAKSWNHTDEDAEDLVQGFYERLIAKAALESVSPDKGRFRSFLRASLRNFLNEDLKRRRAEKRGSGKSPDSLNETDDEGAALREPQDPGATADRKLDDAWALVTLRKALGRLEIEISQTKNPTFGLALCQHLRGDGDATNYQAVAARFGMQENAVKVAAHRLRTRLSLLIREEVRQTLAHPEQDLDDEMTCLKGQFSR